MRYNILIIAVSFFVLAILISRGPSGFTDMVSDKRCYVGDSVLGTPFTFGSGFNGLIYSKDECDKLKGIYKADPSYPIGKGRCYIHDNNFVDDDSYNIACANTATPPPVQEDLRCFINRIKLGYDKPDKTNTVRLYNKKECDMLDGIYNKKTNICGIKGGSDTQHRTDALSYLCGQGFP